MDKMFYLLKDAPIRIAKMDKPLILLYVACIVLIITTIGAGLYVSGLDCADMCSCETSFNWANGTNITTDWG